MTDKELIRQEIERRYNCEKCYQLDREANVAAAVLQELLLFIDSLPEEPASEDLEEEIDNYFKDWTFDDEMSVMVKPNHYFAEFNDIKEIARHFAEWQKQKDQETIELAEEHAMLAGMKKMKEKMMKNAVEGEVFSEIKSISGSEFRVRSNRFKMNGIKMSDKVKIVILKTE